MWLVTFLNANSPNRPHYRIKKHKRRKMEGSSAFVEAAACGDLEDIKRMLADDRTTEGTINQTDKNGQSPLHYACVNQDINLLLLLVADKRVDVAKLTPKGDGIFHLAALYSSLQAIEILLQSERVMRHPRRLLNLPNKFRETPLHLCAGSGHKDSGKTAMLLMQAGASLVAVDQWRRGPIDVAKFNGHVWLAQVLMEYLRELPENVQEVVREMSEEAMREQLAPVTMNARDKENRRAMQRMLGAGLNFELKRTGTLHKYLDSAPKAKQNDVKTPSTGQKRIKSLSSAILSKLVEFPGNKEEISRLINDPEVDVAGKDAFGLTALHKFASWNKTELIEIILPQLSPEQLNDTDLEGKTALHWACEMASVATVRYLVAKGADKDLRDTLGRSPMDILNNGRGSAIERLKKALSTYRSGIVHTPVLLLGR